MTNIDWLKQESKKRAEKYVKELLKLTEEEIKNITMNYNKKTKSELIKIAQDTEKEIRSLHDVININNGVIVELREQIKKDEKYYNTKTIEHVKDIASLKKAIDVLKNKNLFQRILNR